MARPNGRPAHPTWALAAGVALAVSFAVAFLALSSASADAPTATRGSSGLRYALLPISGVPSASVSAAVAAAIGPSPHGPTYSTTADQCATCHRTHTGKSRNLLKTASPQSTLCFTCHDGLGALTNVQVQYTAAGGPANVPANREYYRHDATVATPHTSSLAEFEFRGTLNRHSECSDCHNPHKATGTDSAQTPNPSTGWTASGRLSGVSGVSVVNGAAGAPPTTYNFLDGKTDLVTREYQLCFKCHSSFTTLLSNAAFMPPLLAQAQPSKYVLDKAVEFNPANPSFHPVEAKGTNATAAMTASLAGPSPYKLWNFTVDSTIRCSNCHASSAKFTLTAPTTAADGDLPPHTSQFQGILLQNYQDRVLKSGNAAYNNADFALCFMCHTNTPFASSGGGGGSTNFNLHGYHTAALGRSGTTTPSIDTSGAGNGNALCAECHFRLHGITANLNGTQTIDGSRLVNFSPNISGARVWDRTNRSCNLTCHGQSHDSRMNY